MPLNASTENLPATPKALFQLLALEGGPAALPSSNGLAAASVAAFGVAEGVLHALDHSASGSVFFGLGAALLITVATFGISKAYKSSSSFQQVLSAIGLTGAVIALASVLLHFVFAVALPPPLPTDRLVRFLLFPIALWQVFMFAYVYRYAGLRLVPGFAAGATIAIVLDFIMATLIK